jgi:hypothetical protein
MIFKYENAAGDDAAGFMRRIEYDDDCPCKRMAILKSPAIVMS